MPPASLGCGMSSSRRPHADRVSLVRFRRPRRVALGFAFPRCFGAMRTDPPDDERGKNQRQDHECGAASDGFLDGLVGVTGHVTQQDEPDAPHEAAGCVEGEKSPVRHTGGACQGGHHSTEERYEPAEEHGPAAAATQELLGVVQAAASLVQDAYAQYLGTDVPTDLVADRVADDGSRDDQHDHQPQLNTALAGDDAAEHGGGLTGKHEADEQRVLGEYQRGDDEIDNDTVEVGQPIEQAAHIRTSDPGGTGTPVCPVLATSSGCSRGWSRDHAAARVSGTRRRSHPRITTAAPMASPARTSPG